MPRTKISVAQQHNFHFAIFNTARAEILIESKTTHSIDPSMLIDESQQNIRFNKKVEPKTFTSCIRQQHFSLEIPRMLHHFSIS